MENKDKYQQALNDIINNNLGNWNYKNDSFWLIQELIDEFYNISLNWNELCDYLGTRFVLSSKGIGYNIDIEALITENIIEIIGNIFDNPELRIKEEK